ncbi:MAG: helix-turn-helix transcriptional regulator [Clostridia bacterium]|nr:helix-turn-helix transcriptional regulator [Clostridia bacterium]
MATTKKFIRFSSKSGIYYCHSMTDYERPLQNSYRTSMQVHTACEVFMLLRGEVTYYIEGKAYEVKPMELILVPPHTNHYTVIDTAQPYERIALEFSPDLIPTLAEVDLLSPFKNASLYFYKIPATYSARFDLEKSLKSFGKNSLRKDKYRDVDLLQSLILLCKKLSIAVEELSFHSEQATPREKMKVSQLCIAYINAHIEENITVETLAEAIHVSPSHILHQFKKEVGKTLHKYVTLQKMQTANTLLQSGISPVEVARRLGYEYYSTFYNNYLTVQGRSPSECYKAPATFTLTNTVFNE